MKTCTHGFKTGSRLAVVTLPLYPVGMIRSPSSPRANATTPEPAHPAALRRCLGPLAVTAQGIAAIGLSGTAVINIPQIIASAGNSTWLCYLAAFLVVLLVTETLILFRQLPATAEGIACYVRDGLGDRLGNLAGWTLLLGYAGSSICCLAVFGQYLDLFCGRLGFGVPTLVGVLAGGLFCLALARRGAGLSAMTMLASESISVLVIIALCGLILLRVQHSVTTIDFFQTADSFSTLQNGMVLAVLSFVGFESTATLGQEALDPLRTVPRALRTSVWISGCLFLFWAFVLNLGLAWLPASQRGENTALVLLADHMGRPGAGALIGLGGFLCFFGATLANLMACGRVVYSLAGRGLLPAYLAGIHPRLHTPVAALAACSGIVISICCGLLLRGLHASQIFDSAGSFGVLGFLCCYLLVAMAAWRISWRQGWWQTLLPGCTAAVLLAITASFLLTSGSSLAGVIGLFIVLLSAGAVLTLGPISPLWLRCPGPPRPGP